MSSICCLYIPDLRRLDAHLVRRGFLRFHRMARLPCLDLLGLRRQSLTVDSYVLRSPFPAELAGATRGPNLGFPVPDCVRKISRLSLPWPLWGRLVFVIYVGKVGPSFFGSIVLDPALQESGNHGSGRSPGSPQYRPDWSPRG